MFKLYSARMREQNGEPDVFVYDNFPEAFRTQVFFILSDMIKIIQGSGEDGLWDILHNHFCREIGKKELVVGENYNPYSTKKTSIESYIDKCEDAEFLDFVDFAFSKLGSMANENLFRYIFTGKDMRMWFEPGINELNDRFRQHCLGYEFSNGEILRIDNQFIHSEYVKPSLMLLNCNGFEGAEEEYRNAYDCYRRGDNKDAITNAAKSFESVMKTICDKMHYEYEPAKATAKALIETLKNNKFFPEYLSKHLNAVCDTLLFGAPAIRNKETGHGQGSEIQDVPECYVNYVLGLVAVNNVLLVNIYKEHK